MGFSFHANREKHFNNAILLIFCSMDMIGAHADLEVLWLLTLVKVIGKAR